MLDGNGSLAVGKPFVDVGDRKPGSQYYSNVRHEMVPFLPSEFSRVLEVGCGEGVFAPLLARPMTALATGARQAERYS